jgi:hypothetical protein
MTPYTRLDSNSDCSTQRKSRKSYVGRKQRFAMMSRATCPSRFSQDAKTPNNQMQRTCRKVTHSAREEQNARLFATPLIWALGRWVHPIRGPRDSSAAHDRRRASTECEHLASEIVAIPEPRRRHAATGPCKRERRGRPRNQLSESLVRALSRKGLVFALLAGSRSLASRRNGAREMSAGIAAG